MNTADTCVSDDLQQRLVEMRRDFHRYPESGWTEFRTASIVVEKLTGMGYEISYGSEVLAQDSVMGAPTAEEIERAAARAIEAGADEEIVANMEGGLTGVVATLDTGRDGPTVAFRFDMDANDIGEAQDDDHRPYREGFASEHDGIMHACGHDAHTAMGLGLAEVLAGCQDELRGKLKLIFQPAEEGVRGAKAMADAGVVDDVDYLIGLHVGLKCGPGEMIAGARDFLATSKANVTFTGVPAHAGVEPESGRNALLAAANAAINLHAISRHSDGATRINVGTLNAGSGRNVIPAQARMILETRGADTTLNEFMWERAEEVLQGCALTNGVDLEVDMVGAAVGGESDARLAEEISRIAADMTEISDVQKEAAFGGSEDYTYFMERVQEMGGRASFIVLGTELAAGHHQSYFDIDEEVMTTGVKLLGALAGKLTSME